jgi:hypothetical protein
MEQQLSLHLKKFNDRVKVLNQTNAREMVLTAAEARQLQADIFDLLTQIQAMSVVSQQTQNNDVVDIEMDGGGF